MAYQKKVYRGNRSRGGIPGKTVDSGSAATGNTPRNYGATMQKYWGQGLEDAQKKVADSIRRAKEGF